VKGKKQACRGLSWSGHWPNWFQIDYPDKKRSDDSNYIGEYSLVFSLHLAKDSHCYDSGFQVNNWLNLMHEYTLDYTLTN
jgi:hypothetical protein